MFELVYTFVETLLRSSVEMGVSISTNTYVITSHVLAIGYFATLVLMYLFMAFGLKQALVKRNKAPTIKVWIPLLQLTVMVDLVDSDKIFNMDKKLFSVLIITFLAISRVTSLTYDIIAYSKYVFSVLYSTNDIVFSLNATGPKGLSSIYTLSNLVFSILSILLCIAYFKTRTTSYIAYVVVSAIFGTFITTILVFATRKREVVSKKIYLYDNTQQTNPQSFKKYSGGNVSKPFSEFSQDDDLAEPFSEFSQDGEGEPFGEFSNKGFEEKNATDFVKDQESKNSNTSDDDDMF